MALDDPTKRSDDTPAAPRPSDRPATPTAPPLSANDVTPAPANNTTTTPSARPTMGDVAQHSIEARMGGGAGGDSTPLGDKIYQPPSGNFDTAAREYMRASRQSEGQSAVTHMTVPAGDKTISGPVSYSRDGKQQFIIDSQPPHSKFIILPPGEGLPNGGLQPFGKNNTEKPIPLDGRPRATPGFESPTNPTKTNPTTPSDRSKEPGARTNDAGQPRVSHPGEKPTNVVAPVDKPPGDKHAPGEKPIAGEKTAPGEKNTPVEKPPAGDKPVTPNARPLDGTPPVVPHVKPNDAPAPIPQPKPVHDGPQPVSPNARPVEAPQQPVSPNARPNPNIGVVTDGKDRKFDQGKLNDSGYNVRPDGKIYKTDNPTAPLTRDDYSRIREARIPAEQNRQHGRPEGQQEPRPVLRPEGPRPDAPVRAGGGTERHEGGGRPEGNRYTQEQLRELNANLGKNPESMRQFMSTADPRVAAQLASTQSERIHGGVSHEARNLNLNPQERGRALDAQLGQQATRLALADSLGNMQNGKFPPDMNAQQIKSMQDFIKAMGPERMQSLRQTLQETPANQPFRLDGKFDTATQARVRDVFELTLNPNALAVRRDGQTGLPMTPSERILETLKMTDKTQSSSIVPDAATTRNIMQEMGRILKEQQTVPGMDAVRTTAMRDLVGRTIDTALPNVTERREFVVRTQDDAAMRVLTDRLNPTRTETDARKVELGVKPETTIARPEVKIDQTARNEEVRIAANRDLAVKETTNQPNRPVVADRVEGDIYVAPVVKAAIPTGKSETDEQNRLEEEKKTKKREEEKDDKPDLKHIDAAAIAALAAKKRKDDAEKGKQEAAQEKDKKEPEKRTKYIVRQGDTLEGVAGKMLRDKRLSGLIYEINRDTIPVRTVAGKSVPELQPRSVIWMPTTTDIKDYRVKLMTSAKEEEDKPKFATAEDELAARFGSNWQGADATAGASSQEIGSIEDMENAARLAYQSRRQNIESILGPLSSNAASEKPKYVVRLGDSLKSIAMKHPAINDVFLWKLLAEINDLPTNTDAKGAPIATIKRGQTLLLPLAQDVEAFRLRESGRRPEAADKLKTYELPKKSCPQCSESTFVTAILCPNCGTEFGLGSETTSVVDVAVVHENATTFSAGHATSNSRGVSGYVTTGANEIGATASSLQQPAPVPSSELNYAVERSFCDWARLSHAGMKSDVDAGYRLRLEMKFGENYFPVVLYEIFAELSMRHEYRPDGQCKSIKFDLPPSASLELATNDLASNWEAYCDKYTATVKAPI